MMMPQQITLRKSALSKAMEEIYAVYAHLQFSEHLKFEAHSRLQ